MKFLLVSVCNVNRFHCKQYIGLWYRPPVNSEAVDVLSSVLKSLDVNILSNFILIGDFNIDFCNSHHPLFFKLSCILHSFILTQVVSEPTHAHQFLIDLALLSILSKLVTCEVVPPLCNSDHDGISLTVSTPLPWKI